MDSTPGTKFTSVPEYLATFPAATRKVLQELRRLIRDAAPGADETISYNMPAYRQTGMLVYFAGYKNHIGFYPTGAGIRAFEKEFGSYKYSKGAVQFPLDEPLPAKLIQRIVRFRVKEEQARALAKTKKRR